MQGKMNLRSGNECTLNLGADSAAYHDLIFSTFGNCVCLFVLELCFHLQQVCIVCNAERTNARGGAMLALLHIMFWPPGCKEFFC